MGGANLHDFHAFTPTVANIRPTSRGEISISSSDTKVNPKIKMNYLSTDEDRKVAADGIKLIRKIVMETNEFKKYEPEEFRPGSHLNDKEEIVKAINKLYLKDYLLTKNIPDPDLLIRSGGFSRLSDFIIYQITFTELIFTKKLSVR